MIGWLLARIEQNPLARFSGCELRHWFADQVIREALDSRILRRVEGLPPERLFDPAHGRFLHVFDRDGQIIAQDEDGDGDPLALLPADWVRYEVDLLGLAERFQSASRLTGTPRLLDDRRLLLLGQGRDHGLIVPVVLALEPDGASLFAALRGLAPLLEPPWDWAWVLSPSVELRATERQALLSLRVRWQRLSGEEPFVVTVPPTAGAASDAAWVETLTEEEEAAAEAAGFKSHLPIRIYAERVKRQYRLNVAGHPVGLTEAEFQLFLRLVVGLRETPDGWLSREELQWVVERGESYQVAPEGIEAAWSRLRVRFLSALGDVPLFEVESQGGHWGRSGTSKPDRASRRRRLSTHLRFVRWDQEVLGTADSLVVRILAARLVPTRPVTAGQRDKEPQGPRRGNPRSRSSGVAA